MKVGFNKDLRKLAWPMAVLAGLVGTGAALAWWSQGLEKQARQEFEEATALYQQTETRLRQVRTEEQEIKDKSALFLRLTRDGIIGEEKRLDWTELLRDIQHQLRLPQMRYEFAPQRPLEPGSSGEYAFYASLMRLHLDLVHEEDLLGFLAAVQARAKAMVAVRSCAVARIAEGAPSHGSAQLSADCELDSITARGTGTR